MSTSAPSPSDGGAGRPLRIGVLLDDMTAAAWAWHMLQRIRGSEYAEIVVLVTNAAVSVPQRRTGVLSRLTRHRWRIFAVAIHRALAWIQHQLIERTEPAYDAHRRIPLDELLAGIPRLAVRPARSRWSDRFTAGDLERLAAFDLDVLIRLGFRILKGGVLTSARYGVWSYHHGDNRLNRGGPAGFWESMQEWPATGSTLQILTEDLDNGTVLYRSSASTHPMSVRENRSGYFWTSLAFVPRKLEELHRIGPAAFFARVAALNAEPFVYSRPLYRQPTTRRYAALIARKLVAKARLIVSNRFFRSQWIVLYDLRDGFSSALWRYRRLLPPPDRFWADPHALERNGRYHVFIEEFPYGEQRGHIAAFTIDADGRASTPVPVLERPYHLSNPFVFEHEGEVYMIPESAENATVDLYRAVEFPLRWQLQETLLEGICAYDATLAFHDGRYWLFAAIAETPGASSWDELHVFFADRPFGAAWRAHPMNPVVSDCRSARPAGALFTHGSHLYRPAQDSSHRYGYGFCFARIDVLTEDDYREVVVSRVSPDWAPDVLATHTFNRAGALHVIDAQVRVRRR